MKSERYPYVSYQLPWAPEGQVGYIMGHSEYVQLLFHPNPVIHEHASWLLDLDVKYNRAYRFKWWSLRIPPTPFTMVFLDLPAPPTKPARAGGWLLTLYALWRAL